jgi:galactose-1-phosphate uridylyltransferase
MRQVMMNKVASNIQPFLTQFEIEIISPPKVSLEKDFPDSSNSEMANLAKSSFEFASKITLVKQETTDDE